MSSMNLFSKQLRSIPKTTSMKVVNRLLFMATKLRSSKVRSTEGEVPIVVGNIREEQVQAEILVIVKEIIQLAGVVDQETTGQKIARTNGGTNGKLMRLC